MFRSPLIYLHSETVVSSATERLHIQSQIIRVAQLEITPYNYSLSEARSENFLKEGLSTRGALTRLGIRYERAHDEMLLTKAIVVEAVSYLVELMCTRLQNEPQT